MLLKPLAAAVTGGLLVLAIATPPVHAADGQPEVARRASSLVEAVGLCVHLAYEDTPYADVDQVIAALQDLGVRHVRDDLFLGDPDQYAAIREVANAGVRFDLIAGRPGDGHTAWQYVTQAAALMPAVESVEGPNEWDISGRRAWASQLRAYQAKLYTAMNANRATAALPVLGPALAFSSNAAALGSIEGSADIGNGHLYTGGPPPSTGLDAAIASLRAGTGVSPVMFTETGYHNAVNTTNGHRPVPEDVAGVYMPRLVLEHFARGVQRAYTYELVDEFDDPAHLNPEAGFGLLRHDWSPKPAYYAMRNLLDLAEIGGAGPTTPGSLAYTLSGAPSDTRHVLIQRGDGAFVLYLWRDVSVYDTASRTRLQVAPTTVTVQLGTPAAYDVQRPSESAASQASGGASSITVGLDGQVTALVLRPGA